MSKSEHMYQPELVSQNVDCKSMFQQERDFRVENQLKKQGYDFQLVAIDINEVDEELGDKHQGRDTQLRSDVVDGYALEVKNGTVFPAGVLVEEGGKFGIAGGKHRFYAMKKEGKKKFLAYLIKSDVVPSHLSKELNMVESVLSLSMEERKRAAAEAHGNGLTQAEAAKKFLISKGVLNTYERANKVRKSLASLGGPSNFVESKLVEMSPIQNGAVLKEMAKVVQASNLTVPEIKTMAKEIKENYKDQTSMLTVVASWASQYGANTANASAAARQNPLRKDLLGFLSAGERLLRARKTGIKGFQIGESQVEVVKNRAKNIVSFLSDLIKKS